jgi:hypothetical protein
VCRILSIKCKYKLGWEFISCVGNDAICVIACAVHSQFFCALGVSDCPNLPCNEQLKLHILTSFMFLYTYNMWVFLLLINTNQISTRLYEWWWWCRLWYKLITCQTKEISRYVMSKRVTMLNVVVVADILWLRRKCNTLKMVASRSLIWCNVHQSLPYWPPGTKGVKHKNHFAVSQDLWCDCICRLYSQISEWVEILKCVPDTLSHPSWLFTLFISTVSAVIVSSSTIFLNL